MLKKKEKGKKRASYGKYLIKKLLKKLTNEFGKGFNVSNLKCMKDSSINYFQFAIHCVTNLLGRIPRKEKVECERIFLKE